jgi:hypothetical protein
MDLWNLGSYFKRMSPSKDYRDKKFHEINSIMGHQVCADSRWDSDTASLQLN